LRRYRVTVVERTVKYGRILFSFGTMSGMGLEMGMLNKLPVVTMARKNRAVTTTAAISIGLRGVA
jgi:hypothetical protein